MRKLVPLAILTVALVAADKPAPKNADRDRIQGRWALTTLERSGQEIKLEGTLKALKDATITFKDDSCTHSATPNRPCHFKLDPDSKPAALDMEVSEQGVKVVFRYLYELDRDDTLRLCLGKQSDVRPKAFTSRGEQVIVTYKRQK